RTLLAYWVERVWTLAALAVMVMLRPVCFLVLFLAAGSGRDVCAAEAVAGCAGRDGQGGEAGVPEGVAGDPGS
ncbi:MAG TPA: hypothetical protein VKU77_32865, partial [Streptosporangiaceae bacterium]|nr:hypothetical protein [Streptosporangiaceae bacterium]